MLSDASHEKRCGDLGGEHDIAHKHNTKCAATVRFDNVILVVGWMSGVRQMRNFLAPCRFWMSGGGQMRNYPPVVFAGSPKISGTKGDLLVILIFILILILILIPRTLSDQVAQNSRLL